MNLYLDCEFNGHGGELISLALADERGAASDHWYGVWPLPENVHPWVAENVIPKLGMVPCQPGLCRLALREYIKHRSGDGRLTIWADWPDDFAHLMRVMSGPSYDESWMVDCTMKLITTPPGEPKPETPHNALSDAIALMRWHQSLVQ